MVITALGFLAALACMAQTTPNPAKSHDDGLELPPFKSDVVIGMVPFHDMEEPGERASKPTSAACLEKIDKGDRSASIRIELAKALDREKAPRQRVTEAADEACVLAEAAVKSEPANARARLEYGRALAARGWTDRALVQLRAAVAMDPKLWEAGRELVEITLDLVFNLGVKTAPKIVADMPRQFADMERLLSNTIDVAPEGERPHLKLLLANLRFGRVISGDLQSLLDPRVSAEFHDAAIRIPDCPKLEIFASILELARIALLNADRLSPDNLKTEEARATQFAGFPADAREAVDAIERRMIDATHVHPDLADAWLLLAGIRYLRGMPAEPAATLESGARLVTTSSPLLEPLFVLSFVEGQWDQCRRIGAIMVLGADTERNRCLLGKLEAATGNLDEAEEQYRLATTRPGSSGDGWLGLALLRRHRGAGIDEVATLLERRSAVVKPKSSVPGPDEAATSALLHWSDELTAANAGQENDLGGALRRARLCAALERHDRVIVELQAFSAGLAAGPATSESNEALRLLGNAYAKLGDVARALAVRTAILQRVEASGSDPDRVLAEAEIAESLAASGRVHEAIEHAERSRAILKSNDAKARIARDLSTGFLLWIGKMHGFEGALDAADACFREVTESADDTEKGRKSACDATEGLSHTALHRGHVDEAIALGQRALAMAEELGQDETICEIMRSLGECYMKKKELGRAVSYLGRAAELTADSGARAQLRASLASIEGDRGADAEALDGFGKALDEIESVNRRVLPESTRSALLESWSFVAPGMSRSVSRMAQSGAKDAVERGFPLLAAFQARMLFEGLDERLRGVAPDVDAALAVERDRIVEEMKRLRLALAADPSKSAELQEELKSHQGRLDDLELGARARDDRLARLDAAPRASLARFQSEALTDDDVLFDYVLGDHDEIYLWVVTRSDATVLRIEDAKGIRADYDRLRTSLTASGANATAFVAPARSLYQRLLGGAEGWLAKHKNLLIVPDDFLGFLPFEVLLTEDVDVASATSLAQLPYLLRRMTVRYLPSAAALLELASRNAQHAERRKDVLLVGDPIYSSEKPPAGAAGARVASTLGLDRLSRLPRTRAEVTAVAASLVGDSEAKLLLELRDLPRSGHVSGARFDLRVGSEASEAALKSSLRGYRIVHLATHGFFDTEWPWFSGVALSADDARGATGFLDLVDLGLLDLDAEIVFLSACETAVGPTRRSEGVRCAARSLLLAGARSVVATQWSVLDDAAELVAPAFYAELFRGAAPADALRAAKIRLLEQKFEPRGASALEPAPAIAPAERFAHPSCWAPFVLWG